MLLDGRDKIRRRKGERIVEMKCAPCYVGNCRNSLNEGVMLTPENERKTEAVERTSRFQLGQVIATPGALEALARAEVTPLRFLGRHETGDWGDLSDEDIAENEFSLKEGFRLLSAYTLPGTGERIWIITEDDRSITRLMLPEEY